jgi:translation initiation factor IF-2
MIKNKQAKKDPELLKALQAKMMAKAGTHKKLNALHSVKLKTVTVWNGITVAELAVQADLEADDLFEVIFDLQYNTDWLTDEHQGITDRRLLSMVAKQLHYKLNFLEDPLKERKVVDRDARRSPPPEAAALEPRPPVVTIMGHIDHGKTSLLDHLRRSRIVAGEAGGITQHIGAFSVQLEGLERKVTIIDTPGHAAFTAMRTRGAVSTDIVILIVDSCEGVLEQTKESLRIIRQARVPFIVALNKIDKAGADVEMVKLQLEVEGVLLEDRGGEVQCVPISALKGTNVRQLIEAVLAQAELLELRGDPHGSVEGVVIEGQTEAGLGRTATVLLRRGTLAPGAYLVCGLVWAKVRLLLGDRGERLATLGPGGAAKVVGWRGEEVPGAGAEVLGVGTEARAREVAAWRAQDQLRRQAGREAGRIDEQRAASREVGLSIAPPTLHLTLGIPRLPDQETGVRLVQTEIRSGRLPREDEGGGGEAGHAGRVGSRQGRRRRECGGDPLLPRHLQRPGGQAGNRPLRSRSGL